MQHDDDDLDPVERYAFQPGEREAIARDIAERQAAIERDDTLAWATQYNAQRRESERAAVQAERKPEQDRSTMTTNTDQWAAFIDRRIRAHRKAFQKSLLGAIGDVLWRSGRRTTRRWPNCAAKMKACANAWTGWNRLSGLRCRRFCARSDTACLPEPAASRGAIQSLALTKQTRAETARRVSAPQ